MTTVYKYALSTNTETTVELPWGANLLKVDSQNDCLFLWALVDTEITITRFVRIGVYGTEEPMPIDAKLNYINTLFLKGGAYVFHAFEVIYE